MNVIHRAICFAAASISCVVLTACGGDTESTPAPAASPSPSAPEPVAEPAAKPAAPSVPSAPVGVVDVTAGQADYVLYCASCHGVSGAGDGPLAAALDPRPAHHNDGNYMNALTDEHLFRVIKEGGAAVGKSTMMAPWGGSLSDDQIRNVIAFIRSLAKPPYSP